MALTVEPYNPGTISGVTNDPNYSGTLAVGDGSTAVLYGDGSLQGSGTQSAPVSGGGGTYTDPYARWGGQTQYNNLVGNYGATQSGYESGARTSMGDLANQYRSSVQGLYNRASDTQSGINEGRINNALSLRRTMQTIINGVRQGLRSGGVTLSTMNALDSGAAEAMARALAQQGNAQGENANAQYETQNDAFDSQQNILNRDLTQGKDNLSVWKDTETNRVRNDTFNKLAVLKADADAQGIDIVNTGLADQIVSEGLAH